MKEKSLLEKIAIFLNYLQINDYSIEKRSSNNTDRLFKKSGERFRIQNLCKKGNLVYDESPERLGNDNQIPQITIEGIKFLENFKKERNQEERLDAQTYLTAGLFTVAFLQATISIIYYFFDLQVRGFNVQANIFCWGSVIGTILFFIILIRNFKKRR